MTTSVREDVEKTLLCTVGGNINWFYHYGNSSKNSSRIITWSNNPTLGIYPKEIKTRYENNIFTPMFTAALLTAAKMWKQPMFIHK